MGTQARDSKNDTEAILHGVLDRWKDAPSVPGVHFVRLDALGVDAGVRPTFTRIRDEAGTIEWQSPSQ